MSPGLAREITHACRPAPCKVQGIPVSDAADHRRVRDILTDLPPGAPFTMTVLRLGQVIELTGRHP